MSICFPPVALADMFIGFYLLLFGIKTAPAAKAAGFATRTKAREGKNSG